MPEQTNADNLRALPSVDALLRTPEAQSIRERVGAEHLTALARAVTEGLRAELRARAESPREETNGDGTTTDEAVRVEASRAAMLSEAARRLAHAARAEESRGLRRVINATGVVLHTNLGRAPLSTAARRAVAREAAGYCTLEYDTEAGARGRSEEHTSELQSCQYLVCRLLLEKKNICLVDSTARQRK